MQLFVITSHCSSRLHCQLCRNKEGGRKWRADLAKNFTLPDNKIDFECPYGKQWQNTGKGPAPKPTLPFDGVVLKAQPQTIKGPDPIKVQSTPILAASPQKVAQPTETPQEAPRERSGSRGGCGCGRG